MSKPFGFKVEYVPSEEWDEDSREGWHVALPHQCDAWDIAGEFCYPVPQQEAIDALGRFITEAQEALVALCEGRQINADGAA